MQNLFEEPQRRGGIPGIGVFGELCQVPAVPTSIASFIERVCDEPAVKRNVAHPTMFVEQLIDYFCSIVTKTCRMGPLQQQSSPNPSTHAHALLSFCVCLFKRFNPLADPHSLDAGCQLPIATSFVLKLLHAAGCLLDSSAPFPQEQCSSIVTDFLRYIEVESDNSIKFALLSCLGPALSKLDDPQAAVASALDACALLAIVSEQLKKSASAKEALPSIRFCETSIHLLCGTTILQDSFPDDLLPSFLANKESSSLRNFFQEAQSSPHAARLHGGMEVSGMTLKEAANLPEGPLNVLGYAAATNMDDAVRLLLQVGADPQHRMSNGQNASDMCMSHNSSGHARMTKLFETIKEKTAPAITASAPKAPPPDVCLVVARVIDVLLDAADVTTKADVCFAILRSLFNVMSVEHPALLENTFISVIAPSTPGSGRSPRVPGSPTASRSPLADSEPLSPASRFAASVSAQRLFKLLSQVAKKFFLSETNVQLANAALNTLLSLLKLPTSRPLARLCQKYRLVDLLSHRDSPGAVVAELRAILESHMASPSDCSHIVDELEAIAHALTVAVVGPAALPQPTARHLTARDALNFLCDSNKVSGISNHRASTSPLSSTLSALSPCSPTHLQVHTYMQNPESPEIFKVISAAPLSNQLMYCRSLSLCAGHQSAVRLRR